MCKIYKEWFQNNAADVSDTQESVLLEHKLCKTKDAICLVPSLVSCNIATQRVGAQDLPMDVDYLTCLHTSVDKHLKRKSSGFQLSNSGGGHTQPHLLLTCTVASISYLNDTLTRPKSAYVSPLHSHPPGANTLFPGLPHSGLVSPCSSARSQLKFRF